jgi:hypothetical protein
MMTGAAPLGCGASWLCQSNDLTSKSLAGNQWLSRVSAIHSETAATGTTQISQRH